MDERVWKEVRELFPIVKTMTYLDNAAMSPLGKPVSAALERYRYQRELEGGRFDLWWDKADQLREQIARLVHCDPKQVAFTSGTTDGLNVVAQGLFLEEGDNVLLSEYEFPANIHPWLNLRKRGIEVRFIPGRNNGISMADLCASVDHHTRVLSISHVAFCNGFRADLRVLGEFCSNRNITFVVDGMQSVGALQIDFALSRIDALSFGGFKWLLGPDGLGFLCCSKRLLSLLRPAYVGWAGMMDRFNFFSHDLNLADGARRIELGNLNFSAIMGMEAALNLIELLGVNNVEKRVLGLADYLLSKLEGLADIGVQLHVPLERQARSQIVCFETQDPERTASALQRHRIRVGRPKWFRVSPHFYNSEEELDRLVIALQESNQL